VDKLAATVIQPSREVANRKEMDDTSYGIT
jgi:hypothetical protein